MDDIKNKVPFKENEEISEELMDSLSQWAFMEGYAHHPQELAKLFMSQNKTPQ